MRDKITAVVVIYNKTIANSLTCQKLREIDRYMDILVIDNSELENNNQEYCCQNEIRYLSMHGNQGLSKAYNVAIDHCKESDAIVLLDDDTEVTAKYFDKLYEALEVQQDVDIFAPIIRGQDGVIYSPNEFHFLRNHFISSAEQEVPQESFNAIASCLCIRMRVFEDYRFNEYLFVDQVDQFFFCEQRKLGKKFGKIDTEIFQNFYQRGAELTPEAGWKRLQLRIVDIYRHAKLMGERKYHFLALVKCCGLGLQIARKSKSVGVAIKASLLSLKVFLRGTN